MTQDFQYKIENIVNRNPQADDSEILFQLKQLIYETEFQTNDSCEAKNIGEIIRQFNEETPLHTIIQTGFNEFDAQFCGFNSGEFVVVGGRPSMGKTQFLINLSLHISQSFPVLYITLDLSEFLLTNRFISSVTGIPVHNILQNDLSEKQKKNLSTIGDAFAKHQLFISDSGNHSIEAIKAHCQKQIHANGVKVIVVDYLQLMNSYKQRKYRELEVSHISRELKLMAKENDVCVVASSQLSRAVEGRYGLEGKIPQLSDLRESGAIEQDADKVIFIHRPEYYRCFEDSKGNSLVNLAEIIVAKNRNGRLGSFYLMRDEHFTNFSNINYKQKNNFTFSSDRLFELEEDVMPF